MKTSGRRDQSDMKVWNPHKFYPTVAGLAAMLLLSAICRNGELRAQENVTEGESLFVTRVLPVFQEKCLACHGKDPQDLRGEFDMRSRTALLAGGESELPALVVGKPQESPLYEAIRWEGLEMPPKENDRLSPEQIEAIGRWIEVGAPWPDEERIEEIRQATRDSDLQAGIPVATSGGLSPEWTRRPYPPENLWAYQPLPENPAGVSESSRHPVDYFIEAQLQQRDLEPAPLADRATLIRRAHYDLIGLPPTAAEIRSFVEDPAPLDEAFARVVERLLDSPHYGEQWGRRWLDVVRYADSSGFANDYERGNAWRYRDYVVRAFNDDKPYDQFIVEQIAGDELDPANPENLVAVGFLRMGPWELTGMEVPKVARQRFLDDVTDSVGQVFLGHMLQCARCHDHKFDPIPTRDYYSFQAVFATTQLVERQAAFLPVENTAGFEEQRYLDQRAKFYQQNLDELSQKQTLEAARQWYAEQGMDPSEFEAVVAKLEQEKPRSQIGLNEVRNRLAKQKVDPATIPPRHVGFEPRDFGLERIARKGLERLRWRQERYEARALSVYDGLTIERNAVAAPLRMPKQPLQEGELEASAILVGGDPFSPGPPVEPGALSVVDLMGEAKVACEITTEVVGRRLELARWIASDKNPLTARVMVNRIWQGHFGRGIADTPNNFGATGKRPTHPELLDFLARRFIQEGWSVKAIHRLIMSSQAYQRSSEHPDSKTLADKDPERESYAAFLPRRLAAEELRDAMLFVSGELNPAVGGIPVRPEMNLEAALQPRQVMGTFAEAWQPSPRPQERHRRSLYALKLRGQRDPFLEVFNAPSPDLSCEAREASTVTPQVFALFNSENSLDRALALADRVLKQELTGSRSH